MSNSSAFVRLGLSLWTAVASFASIADPPSFEISQICSNLDGSTQFIRLTESQGLNGQHHFAGLPLTSVPNGVIKQFTFPSDLPTEAFASTAAIAEPGYCQDWPLPGPGAKALSTDPSWIPTGSLNTARAGHTATLLTSGKVLVVGGNSGSFNSNTLDSAELYDPVNGTWSVTGSLKQSRSYHTATLLPADAGECLTVFRKYASVTWYFESDNVFQIDLPDKTSGACPAGTIPVYRLWNQRVDSNHRYTTSAAIKTQMLAVGYLPEGYGADGVVMCALQ